MAERRLSALLSIAEARSYLLVVGVIGDLMVVGVIGDMMARPKRSIAWVNCRCQHIRQGKRGYWDVAVPAPPCSRLPCTPPRPQGHQIARTQKSCRFSKPRGHGDSKSTAQGGCSCGGGQGLDLGNEPAGSGERLSFFSRLPLNCSAPFYSPSQQTRGSLQAPFHKSK